MTNSKNGSGRDRRFDTALPPNSTISVLGDPTNPFAKPTVREATLDDVEDDCPLCQEMARQILAGNPPQVMVYE